MEPKIDLMDIADDIVNDSFQAAGERDHLVKCECSWGKFRVYLFQFFITFLD
jgi:hypothetical protein